MKRRGGKLGKTTGTLGALKGLLLLSLVAACGTSGPQINPSTRVSTDPVLASLVATFRNACVANAPDFTESRMKAAFSAKQPVLAPGMMFLATGQAGQRCRVTISGYGPDRPKPTVGDINSLGQSLHARLGGTFKPKSADTGAGGAKVKVNRRSFRVSAYVAPNGYLTISLSQ